MVVVVVVTNVVTGVSVVASARKDIAIEEHRSKQNTESGPLHRVVVEVRSPEQQPYAGDAGYHWTVKEEWIVEIAFGKCRAV